MKMFYARFARKLSSRRAKQLKVANHALGNYYGELYAQLGKLHTRQDAYADLTPAQMQDEERLIQGCIQRTMDAIKANDSELTLIR